MKTGDGEFWMCLEFSRVPSRSYHWTAAYSGDSNNAAVSSLCAEEAVVLAQATPTIVTTPNPAAGTVGATLNDSATLALGVNPTGSILFKLFSPAEISSSHDCTPVTVYS